MIMNDFMIGAILGSIVTLAVEFVVLIAIALKLDKNKKK